ncbi:MAG: hypothetical protein ACREOU_15970 [Candidatus Eiseniibacteriota bacterium]
MFGPRKPDVRWWQIILWWEIRRIPYNILVGVWGLACFIVYFIAITSSGHLQPGEDAIEPMALFAAPIVILVINMSYTLGWIVELPLRLVVPPALGRYWIGPGLFVLGTAFSLVVEALPALIWVVIWLFRLPPPAR